MVKITTFNDRPVRHVRYMPDGTVIKDSPVNGTSAPVFRLMSDS